MNEQNIQSGRKKRLFGELTEEEVRELKQSQQDVSCPTANREYAKKRCCLNQLILYLIARSRRMRSLVCIETMCLKGMKKRLALGTLLEI